LIPSASGGFSALSVSTLNTVYVTTAQSAIPATHKAAATRHAPAMSSAWLPRTQVAATVVKKPTARPWCVTSATTRSRNRITRRSVSAQSDAKNTTFSQNSATASRGNPVRWQPMETIPVAITSAKYAGCRIATAPPTAAPASLTPVIGVRDR
jgi:hypothetical protein